MSGSDYYKQAIERALGLMRQGSTRQAQNLLQDALDLKLDMLPEDMLSSELELVFDPHAAKAPTCWIDDGELRIDDTGWEIDPSVVDELVNAVETNIVLGLPTMQVESRARALIRDAVRLGKVRKR